MQALYCAPGNRRTRGGPFPGDRICTDTGSNSVAFDAELKEHKATIAIADNTTAEIAKIIFFFISLYPVMCRAQLLVVYVIMRYFLDMSVWAYFQTVLVTYPRPWQKLQIVFTCLVLSPPQ